MNFAEKAASLQLSKWTSLVPASALNEVPVDLAAIGSCWGVEKVVKRNLDVAGLLYRLENGRFVIFLKEDDPPTRQRFSWAHELGHIIMPQDEAIRAYCRKHNKEDKDLERSCDIIASELLMPKDIFCSAADDCGWNLGSARSLARSFQVSTMSAAIRLSELASEPVLVSAWRSDQGPLRTLKLKWSLPNGLAKSFHPDVRWKTDPGDLGPLYQTYGNEKVASGLSKVLVRQKGESRYRSVLTEALSVGSKSSGDVLAFHYLLRKA